MISDEIGLNQIGYIEDLNEENIGLQVEVRRAPRRHKLCKYQTDSVFLVICSR